MFKSIAISWKGLTTLVVLTIVLAACAPSGETPSSTSLSPLATPAVEENSAQFPTAEVGQAQTQPTESVAQAPTSEAGSEALATEAPTTAAGTGALATEAPTTAAATEVPTTTSASEAPTTTAATEAPTAVAGALQAPTMEATMVPTTTATTPEATVASSAEVTATTAPTATAVSTPSTLPVTGGNNDGSGALSLIIIALGVVVLLGALGVAFARRSQ